MLPVIVLSGRDAEATKVAALDLGADDYMTKPFAMLERLARIRAALRHQLQVQGERPQFRTGNLMVDLVCRIVTLDDREIRLSPKEWELLRLFVQRAGKVLTHRFTSPPKAALVIGYGLRTGVAMRSSPGSIKSCTPTELELWASNV